MATHKHKVIRINAVRRDRPAAAGDGWERLSTLSEPRLTEMAENYRALGYEVQIREVQEVPEVGCTTCIDAGQAMGRVYGTLYIRRTEATQADDELFE